MLRTSLFFPIFFMLLCVIEISYGQSKEQEILRKYESNPNKSIYWLETFISTEGASLRDFLSKDLDQLPLQSLFVDANVESVKSLIFNGSIIQNDSVIDYLNTVKNRLLRSNPALRDYINVYLVNDAEINAVSYSSGLILINTGLFSKLSTESELAFVIAHESAHVLKKHSYMSFTTRKEKQQKRRLRRTRLINDRIDSLFLYSRQQEFEADAQAGKFVQEAGFCFDDAFSMIEKLYYDRISYFNIPFNQQFFNTTHLQFSEEYFLDTVADLEPVEARNDRYYTHPNIPSRLENLKLIADSLHVNGKCENVHSCNPFVFTSIRAYSRLLAIEKCLEIQEYGRCIYEAYCLLKEYPESQRLNRLIPLSLYGLSKYNNENDFQNAAIPYTHVQLEGQQVHYFLRFLSKMELSVLAYEKCIEYELKFGNDTHVDALMDDLLRDIVIKLKPASYVHRHNSWATNTQQALEEICALKRNEIVIRNARRELRKQEDYMRLSYSEKRRVDKKKQKNFVRNGLGLQISKLIIFNPECDFLARDDFFNRDPQLSKKIKQKAVKSMRDFCESNNIELVILDYDASAMQDKNFQVLTRSTNTWFVEQQYLPDYFFSPLLFSSAGNVSDMEGYYLLKYDVVFVRHEWQLIYRIYVVDLTNGHVVYSNYEKQYCIGYTNEIKKSIRKELNIINN